MRIILVANYQPDGQQSMLRFSSVLARELRARGCDVAVLAPRAILGALRSNRAGVGKWLGYVDKFLLFPWTLRAAIRSARRAGEDIVVHVCDHSSAMYTRHLRDVPHLVTCNDLLAVRSALGEIPRNRTRWSGRILQRMILSGLNRAQQVACISEATRHDVLRLSSVPSGAVHRVYMGLNYEYRPLGVEESRTTIGRLLRAPSRRFILHVGGNQWYKNRPGALEIYAELKRITSGQPLPALVMVGERFTSAMRDFVKSAALGADVMELHAATNADLHALYSRAELLLYPSQAEGFGWPVLEAMACGCRVVTSGRPPLTEVGGDAAAYIDPDDIGAAAATTLTILHEPSDARRIRIERGFSQQSRFSTEVMVDNYLALYRSLSARFGEEHGAPIAAL